MLILSGLLHSFQTYPKIMFERFCQSWLRQRIFSSCHHFIISHDYIISISDIVLLYIVKNHCRCIHLPPYSNQVGTVVYICPGMFQVCALCSVLVYCGPLHVSASTTRTLLQCVELGGPRGKCIPLTLLGAGT